MEEIHDPKLNIVGERYASFTEFYTINERRQFNAAYSDVGDRAADSLFSVDDGGTAFTSQDTRDALIYGSDLFAEEFERAKTRARGILHDKYEWLDHDRSNTDVTGSHVIVERYMMGHPEAFRKQEKRPRLERSVHIIYDAMCSASVPVSRRIEAGCAVLAAAEALEKIGYKVAISFALARFSGNSMTGDPTLLLEILLKGYEGHLNIRKTQFSLAAKSMLFHVGCFWSHRFSRTPMDYGEGEGYPVSYDKTRVSRLQQYATKNRGVYLSQDMIDLQMQRDSARVLERIVSEIGAEEELLSHEKTSSMMSAVIQPDQGRMFSSFKLDGQKGSLSHEKSDKGQSREHAGDGAAQDKLQAAKGDDTVEFPGQDSNSGTGKLGNNQISSGDSEGNAASSSGVEGKESRAQSNNEAGPLDEESPLSRPAPGMPAESGFNSSALSSEGTGGASDDGGGEVDGAAMPSGESPLSGGDETSNLSPGGSENDGQDKASQNTHDSKDRPHSEEGGGKDVSSSSKDSSQPSDSGAGSDGAGGMSNDVNMEDAKTEQEPDMEPQSVANDSDEKFEIDTDELDNLEDDPFVIMLRKRFVRFENGEYLDQMIGEKMAKRQAEKRQGNSVDVPAPPKANSAEAKQLEQGAPRCTPYGMTYRP